MSAEGGASVDVFDVPTGVNHSGYLDETGSSRH
jgi:hypothetical protein